MVGWVVCVWVFWVSVVGVILCLLVCWFWGEIVLIGFLVSLLIVELDCCGWDLFNIDVRCLVVF